METGHFAAKVVTRSEWLKQQLAVTEALVYLAQAHAGNLEALLLNEEAHSRACAARHHNLQAATQLEARGLICIIGEKRAEKRAGEHLATDSLNAEPLMHALWDRMVVINNTVTVLADARKWGGLHPHDSFPRRMFRVPSIIDDTAMQITRN
jgi:hypothetical protein